MRLDGKTHARNVKRLTPNTHTIHTVYLENVSYPLHSPLLSSHKRAVGLRDGILIPCAIHETDQAVQPEAGDDAA